MIQLPLLAKSDLDSNTTNVSLLVEFETDKKFYIGTRKGNFEEQYTHITEGIPEGEELSYEEFQSFAWTEQYNAIEENHPALHQLITDQVEWLEENWWTNQSNWTYYAVIMYLFQDPTTSYWDYVENWDSPPQIDADEPPPVASFDELMAWWEDNMGGTPAVPETEQTFTLLEYIEDRDMKISAIKEKIDIKTKKIQLSNINITLSNAIIDGVRFSDKFQEITNDFVVGTVINVYYQTGSAKKLSDCIQIAKLKISRYTHDIKTVKITANDVSVESFYVELPTAKNYVYEGEETFAKYSGMPIPILYGHLKAAPCVVWIDGFETGQFYEENGIYLLPDNSALPDSNSEIQGIKSFESFGNFKTHTMIHDILQMKLGDSLCGIPPINPQLSRDTIYTNYYVGNWQFIPPSQDSNYNDRIQLVTDYGGERTNLADGILWCTEFVKANTGLGHYKLYMASPFKWQPEIGMTPNFHSQALVGQFQAYHIRTHTAYTGGSANNISLLPSQDETLPFYLRYDNDFLSKFLYEEDLNIYTHGKHRADDGTMGGSDDWEDYADFVYSGDNGWEWKWGASVITFPPIKCDATPYAQQVEDSAGNITETIFPTDFILHCRWRYKDNPVNPDDNYFTVKCDIYPSNPSVDEGILNAGSLGESDLEFSYDSTGIPANRENNFDNMQDDYEIYDYYNGYTGSSTVQEGVHYATYIQLLKRSCHWNMQFRGARNNGGPYTDYRHSWMNRTSASTENAAGTNTWEYITSGREEAPKHETTALTVYTAIGPEQDANPSDSGGMSTGKALKRMEFLGTMASRHWAQGSVFNNNFFVNARGRVGREYAMQYFTLENPNNFHEAAYQIGQLKDFTGTLYARHRLVQGSGQTQSGGGDDSDYNFEYYQHGGYLLDNELHSDEHWFYLIAFLELPDRKVVDIDGERYELMIEVFFNTNSDGALYSNAFIKDLEVTGVIGEAPCPRQNTDYDFTIKGNSTYKMAITGQYIGFIVDVATGESYPSGGSGDWNDEVFSDFNIAKNIRLCYGRMIEENNPDGTIGVSKVEVKQYITHFDDYNTGAESDNGYGFGPDSGRDITDGGNVVLKNESGQWFTESPAKQMVTNPVDIMTNVMETELGYSGGFDAAKLFKTQQANNDIALQFSVNEQINSQKLVENIARHSRSMFRFRTRDGKMVMETIKNTYDDSDLDKTINTKNILNYKYDKTKIEDVAMVCRVKYAYDYGNENLDRVTPDLVHDGQFDDLTMQNAYAKYYGVQEDNYNTGEYLIEDYALEFEAEYIQDEWSALYLRDYLFEFHKHQHLIIKMKISLSEGLELEVGDIVNFDSDIGGMKAYGHSITQAYMLLDQIILPYFIVTSVIKKLDSVDVEVMQMHDLTQYVYNQAYSGTPIYDDSGEYVGESLGEGVSGYCTLPDNSTIESTEQDCYEVLSGSSWSAEAPLVLGDINGDGNIDVLDVVFMVNHVLGVSPLFDDQLIRADMNDNGSVDVTDVILLINIILGA